MSVKLSCVATSRIVARKWLMAVHCLLRMDENFSADDVFVSNVSDV